MTNRELAKRLLKAFAEDSKAAENARRAEVELKRARAYLLNALALRSDMRDDDLRSIAEAICTPNNPTPYGEEV